MKPFCAPHSGQVLGAAHPNPITQTLEDAHAL